MIHIVNAIKLKNIHAINTEYNEQLHKYMKNNATTKKHRKDKIAISHKNKKVGQIDINKASEHVDNNRGG